MSLIQWNIFVFPFAFVVCCYVLLAQFCLFGSGLHLSNIFHLECVTF